MVLYLYISQFEQISFQLAVMDFTSLGVQPDQAKICACRAPHSAERERRRRRRRPVILLGAA